MILELATGGSRNLRRNIALFGKTNGENASVQADIGTELKEKQYVLIEKYARQACNFAR